MERAGDIGAALQRARVSGESEAIAATLVRVAYVRFRLGQYSMACAMAEGALTHASPTAPARADAWLILGNCAGETDSLTDAEAFYHRAADLSREVVVTC